jgi:hypothetical protein
LGKNSSRSVIGKPKPSKPFDEHSSRIHHRLLPSLQIIIQIGKWADLFPQGTWKKVGEGELYGKSILSRLAHERCEGLE